MLHKSWLSLSTLRGNVWLGLRYITTNLINKFNNRLHLYTNNAILGATQGIAFRGTDCQWGIAVTQNVIPPKDSRVDNIIRGTKETLDQREGQRLLYASWIYIF